MRLFEGNKSYFRCMEEKLDQPMEEDPDYFVISDSEQEFSVVFGAQGTSTNEWGVGCGTAGRTLQKSCCFGGFEVQVTWQRPRPFARDLRKSHKKAGFSVVLENNPS